MNFFGVISDTPFDKVRLINASNLDDGIGVDDIMIGQAAVPEPSSLVVLITGIGLVTPVGLLVASPPTALR